MTPGADPVVLMVPGYTGSGPRHWQSLWEADHPAYRRVEQEDWDHPDLDTWVATLDRAVREQRAPVVLVGHSCGAATIVHWSARHGAGPVVGALLVAPPDAEAVDSLAEIRVFAPLPGSRLPFPSLLVASDDDPHLRLERASEFASMWESGLKIIPGAGHLNSASGYGPWPEGRRLLAEFLRAVGHFR